ncbi:FixH family protein [Paenibacillus sp. PL91]|uniref:FixH family protein n=1 Tax=Paenibacillus sp. PL91 TaxID=2729538 RepID=UPI00145F6DAA|nr:FixH family protein [Paenibacillus sp. PL91]MBC9199441.1 FixH family protein [Paenibacillus sp. PL91]
MQPPYKSLSPLYKFIILLIAIALLAGLTLTWLRHRDKAPPPISEHTFESGHAIWSIATYPAKALRENRFLIELADESGAALHGASLSVKLEMLDMVCGDYEFKMTEASPGKYEGEGVPLMAGTWKATLTVDTGAQTYTIVRLLKAIH